MKEIFRPGRTIGYSLFIVAVSCFTVPFVRDLDWFGLSLCAILFYILFYMFFYGLRNEAIAQKAWEEEIIWHKERAEAIRKENEAKLYLEREELAAAIARNIQEQIALAGVQCHYRKEDNADEAQSIS